MFPMEELFMAPMYNPVKLCADSLRSMLVAMGEQDPASTKEIMQMLTKDFCIVCGAYFPSDNDRPCPSCLKEIQLAK